MKKLIIINGTMGVGKTTICKSLYKQLENSFWLDGDNCWMMNPFKVDEENKLMVIDNITYMLNNFVKNQICQYVIFNWVIHTDEIMNDIISKLDTSNCEIIKITLTCTEQALINRIENDVKNGIRTVDCITRSIERLSSYDQMNTIKIDTTNKEIATIVNEIKTLIL